MKTLEEKYVLITKKALECSSKNPLVIADSIMKEDFVSPNGPEHHYLDGLAFLVAYSNAGGELDLPKAVEEMKERALKMPGASCGKWGVCCSVTSLGAAFSIIHGTSPLSSDQYYKEHMEYTSSAIAEMARIGGPRCCKRNAFVAIGLAAKFFNNKYGTSIEYNDIKCNFFDKNNECIKEKCPFYKK